MFHQNLSVMRELLFSVCVVACILTSCASEEDLDVSNQIESSGIITIAGKEIEKVNGTLSFESEAELKEIANNLIPFGVTKSVDGTLVEDYSQVNKLRENGFVSLYDVFENALNDVDLYYDREGGYEEFKEKYSCLFFPEVGDDISPYLPISDRNLAMLADANGEVLIANQKVSLKDITTYQQLKDLGLTPPGGITLMAERGDVITGLNSIPETRVGENKVWVKVHYREYDGHIPIARVEVCFRKKYFLGWSNHNSNTSARLSGGSGFKMYTGTNISMQGFSSHDYKYSIPAISGSGYTIPVNQKVTIGHGGTGLTLELTCQYDSYLP